MAARSSLVQSFPGSSSQHRPLQQLPEYEPPQFAMTVDAQRALPDLESKQGLTKVYSDFSAAITMLSESVAEINERLTERRDRQKRRKEKQPTQESGEQQDNGADAEAANPLESLFNKVNSMTERMETGMRQAIDGQEECAKAKELLVASSNNAREQASTQASIQARQSQQQPREARDDDDEEMRDDDDEGEGQDYPEITPTDPGATQSITGPSAYFEDKLADWKLVRSNKSKFDRYADHNEYRNFRNLLHGAQYPDESVPFPAPETWFDEGSLARAGVTQRPGDDDDGDEDLQVMRATTSTRCPITLQEFKEPLTSKKCSHTFEADAIGQMLSASTLRVNQRTTPRGPVGGDPAVPCPVQSCQHVLTRQDLHVDEIIKRRIKHLQRAKQLQDQEMQDGEGEGDGGHTIIEDDDDDALDIDDIEDDDAPVPKKLKSEARSSIQG